MAKLYLKNYKYVCIQGDLHSDFNAVVHFLNTQDLDGCLIINVGDFNMFGKNEQLDELNRYLGLRESHIIVVRGNHDNPSFFNNSKLYENMTFIEDYTVVVANELNILCVGGAISIDRLRNRLGIDYFESEKFVLKDVEESRVDVVITHTAPNLVWPFIQGELVANYALVDETLVSELNEERMLVNLLYEQVKNRGVKQWFYGHFHTDYVTYIGNLRFQCLAPGQIKMLNI